MPHPNSKGISVHVDRELHAEITAYLQENNMKMGDFVALAAQELLRPPSMDIDPEAQGRDRCISGEKQCNHGCVIHSPLSLIRQKIAVNSDSSSKATYEKRAGSAVIAPQSPL